MFENLLCQDEAVGRLRADIAAGELPPSLLFSGPPASGKLTAALELARVLSCERGPGGATGADGILAPWNCPCPSCARHRVLAHPDLLLLGARSFPEEIPAALERLERAPGRASAYFFTRAARKLGKRFDATLYEGEETRLAKAMPLLREAEERLDAVAPERAEAQGLAPGALEAAKAVAAACRKLEGLVPGAPPVFQVRAIETWARLAPNGRKKCVVVENADGMNDASRNALLKILEEPPASVEFVLVSSRPKALIATVLSRVRPYAFKARSPAENQVVVERIFKAAPAGSPSVEGFLAARRAFPPAAAAERAEAFLAAALAVRAERAPLEPAMAAFAARIAGPDGAPSPAAALAALLEATKDFGQKDDAFEGSFEAFLAALSASFGALLREPGLSAPALLLVEGWAALLREARGRRESYNLSASLLAEGLLYALGGA